MYENIIEILENLARNNTHNSKEIGKAIEIVKFCNSHEITPKKKVTKLPEAHEYFGYYILQECYETGEVYKTFNDVNGNPIEITPESIILE